MALAVITGTVIGAAPALIDKFIDPKISVSTQAPAGETSSTYHASFGDITDISGLQFLKDK